MNNGDDYTACVGDVTTLAHNFMGLVLTHASSSPSNADYLASRSLKFFKWRSNYSTEMDIVANQANHDQVLESRLLS